MTWNLKSMIWMKPMTNKYIYKNDKDINRLTVKGKLMVINFCKKINRLIDEKLMHYNTVLYYLPNKIDTDASLREYLEGMAYTIESLKHYNIKTGETNA